jgi:Fur family ferric uptake transcriptional regulator
MLVLHTLRSFPVHPTAVELYAKAREAMPSLSLGTVYRNLEILARSGEVLCLERAGTSRRFDGNTAAHGHVRCTGCGRVGDVVGALPDAVLDNVRSPGFDILGMEVEFTGLCSECRSKAEDIRNAPAPPPKRARVAGANSRVAKGNEAPSPGRARVAGIDAQAVHPREQDVAGLDDQSVRLRENFASGIGAPSGRMFEKTGARRRVRVFGC